MTRRGRGRRKRNVSPQARVAGGIQGRGSQNSLMNGWQFCLTIHWWFPWGLKGWRLGYWSLVVSNSFSVCFHAAFSASILKSKRATRGGVAKAARCGEGRRRPSLARSQSHSRSVSPQTSPECRSAVSDCRYFQHGKPETGKGGCSMTASYNCMTHPTESPEIANGLGERKCLPVRHQTGSLTVRSRTLGFWQNRRARGCLHTASSRVSTPVCYMSTVEQRLAVAMALRNTISNSSLLRIKSSRPTCPYDK